MTIINFYKTRDTYGCFSNFSRHPVDLDDKIWPTSEHYFQAMKFIGDEVLMEQVRECRTPGDAARMGRDRSNPLRKDWESVKDGIMLRVVAAKFRQHQECKDTLLSTGDAKLVEHTENDSYWGDGGDGSGKNRLGQILEAVRRKIRYTKKELHVDGEKATFVIDHTPQEVNAEELVPFVKSFLKAVEVKRAMLTDGSSIYDFMWGNDEFHKEVETTLGLDIEEKESVLSIVKRLKERDQK